MKKCILTALSAFLLALVPLGRGPAGDETQDLLAAFESGDSTEVLRLLSEKPRLLKVDLEEGLTPLHLGVYHGYISVVDYALRNGLDLNLKDRRGLAPVWFSVSGRQPAMLRKLIGLGADLSIKNRQGDDLLFRAATGGNPEIFSLLLDHGFKAD